MKFLEFRHALQKNYIYINTILAQNNHAVTRLNQVHFIRTISMVRGLLFVFFSFQYVFDASKAKTKGIQLVVLAAESR